MKRRGFLFIVESLASTIRFRSAKYLHNKLEDIPMNTGQHIQGKRWSATLGPLGVTLNASERVASTRA
jgi:hypothetical protein